MPDSAILDECIQNHMNEGDRVVAYADSHKMSADLHDFFTAQAADSYAIAACGRVAQALKRAIAVEEAAIAAIKKAGTGLLTADEHVIVKKAYEAFLRQFKKDMKNHLCLGGRGPSITW